MNWFKDNYIVLKMFPAVLNSVFSSDTVFIMRNSTQCSNSEEQQMPFYRYSQRTTIKITATNITGINTAK